MLVEVLRVGCYMGEELSKVAQSSFDTTNKCEDMYVGTVIFFPFFLESKAMVLLLLIYKVLSCEGR